MIDLEVDPKYKFKNTIRGLIFNNDPVLRRNLVKGTQLLYSEAYPTQVFELKGTKYIRVNKNDIERLDDQELEDLLKFMLSSEGFSGYEDDDKDPPTLEEMLTEAADEYQSQTGEDLRESNIVEADDFGNITNTDNIPIAYKSFGKKNKTPEEQEEDDNTVAEEAGEADDMTKSAKQTAKATGMLDDDSTGKKPKQELAEVQRVEIEQALEDVQHYKSKSVFSDDSSILKKKEIAELNQITKQLLKAFKGAKSKEKTVTPRKHMSAKALATDNDRFYINKKAPKGKHIRFNLLIDMSGSMRGDPIRNAVSLIYIFNRLARDGYVTGNAIYSTTREHYVVPLGVSDAEILSLHRTRSSEGLAETVDENVELLRHTNLICITDGDIVDRPIDKRFWAKNKIVSTGVYINKNLKDPLEYSGSLDKWFNHSLVRKSLEEMVQLLVKIGIRG